MSKPIFITELNIKFQPEILSLSQGATIFYQDYFPDFINKHEKLKARDSDRNKYLGYTVSKPKPFKLVFGLTYEDLKDGGQHDEDYFVLDTQEQTITKYYGKDLEKENPEYTNAHHKFQKHLIK